MSHTVPLRWSRLCVRGAAGKHSCNLAGKGEVVEKSADSQSRLLLAFFFPLLSFTDWSTSCIFCCFLPLAPCHCSLILKSLAPRGHVALLFIPGRCARFQFPRIMYDSDQNEFHRPSIWPERSPEDIYYLSWPFLTLCLLLSPALAGRLEEQTQLVWIHYMSSHEDA